MKGWECEASHEQLAASLGSMALMKGVEKAGEQVQAEDWAEQASLIPEGTQLLLPWHLFSEYNFFMKIGLCNKHSNHLR